jgi:transposase
MLLRLPYPALTSVFAFIRLLPMSDTDKDIEILTLRHQLAVLQRQTDRPRLTPPDRAYLAALLHRLPKSKLRQLHLIVSPDTILRCHRDLLRRHHAKASRPKRAGRPPTVRSIKTLVLRLARENPSWGYRRVHGELAALGITVAPSTVWEILNANGIEPAPQRDRQTWTAFLRGQAHAILAADFFSNPHPDRRTNVRLRRHRTRHPPRPRPRRHRPSHRGLDHTTGQEPGHGSSGHRRHGEVPDPRARQQVHGNLRRGLRTKASPS